MWDIRPQFLSPPMTVLSNHLSFTHSQTNVREFCCYGSSPCSLWTTSITFSIVSREIKRKSLTIVVTFTSDQVTKGISSCTNTRAFGPDKLSIFHLKHLESRGIEYLTALINDSVTSCWIWSIWKSFIVIPIPKPDKDFSAHLIGLSRSSVRQIKLWRLSYFQHGVRPGHSTTSALLQLTSDIATGFNQRKPPHRTVCVAVDLMAAFVTVNLNILLSKIVRSTLPEATCQWLSHYLRGRQSVTSCRGVKSKAMIVHTGVPQGTKMSPTLFRIFLADMPRPTEPVKWIFYADDITVWTSGVKLPELEHKIYDYLTEMSRFLRDNSLLISAPKSTVPCSPQTQSRPILTQRSRSLTQSFPLFEIQSCWECI